MHKVALRETPHRGRAGGRTEGASLTIHASRIDATSHRHAAAGREETRWRVVSVCGRSAGDRLLVDEYLRALDDAAQQWCMENLPGIASPKAYIKHIPNMHDGEVRLLGDSEWEEFPAARGLKFTVFHPNFWHGQ